jgi:hypothetical protein
MRDDICAVVMDFRRPNVFLREWLSANFSHVRFANDGQARHRQMGLAEWRNHEASLFLRETDLPWLLMLDDDMVPVPESQALIDSQAPVSGGRFWSRTGNEAHTPLGSIGLGAVKISREVLKVIDPPWFSFENSPCECAYFCKLLMKHGYAAVKAGVFGHLVPTVFVMGSEGCNMAFPPMLRPSPRGAVPRQIKKTKLMQEEAEALGVDYDASGHPVVNHGD